tara:strand:- start:399 stop:806 length:408 start_codon:yes stop_codon:yes gene_type:complete
MADAFPEIKPSTRKFKMGDIPSKTYTSLSGAVFRRAFGNKKSNYTLDLTFKNIPDTTDVDFRSTEHILDHYDGTEGTFSSFSIPNSVFAGMEEAVSDYIQAPANIKWRYAKPPEVQSVQSNLSTVTVSFIGELQA